MDTNPLCFAMQWRIQDFPEEGAPTPQGGRQHMILPIFPENCMKLKEFGPPGGGARPKFYYVDPPLQWINYLTKYLEIDSSNLTRMKKIDFHKNS